MAGIDKEIQRIEQGYVWKETDKVVKVEVKKPLDKVIPVRLSSISGKSSEKRLRNWA